MTTSENWVLTLQDPDDPYAHSAHASQRDATHWDVEYFRHDESVSVGSIGTPSPHTPPICTLLATLRELRTEADYWAGAQ